MPTTRPASVAAPIRAEWLVACALLVGCSGSIDGEDGLLVSDAEVTEAATEASIDGSSDAEPEAGDATGVDSTVDAGDAVVSMDGADAAWCPTDPTARPNEGLVEEAGAPGCPKGMAKIASICVDRFEASIVIVEAGKESSWSPYYPPPSGKTYRAVSLRGAVPQGYVSGAQAKIACEASGKRLCTNDEWLRACQGPSTFTYPYGNTRMPGVCNDARTPHPAISCFGTSASWIYSELDYPGINQQATTVDRTGSNTGCVTSEGLYDMMGNLHEWIWDDPTKYSDPVKAIDFRGGFYADTKVNGDGCLYRTTAHSFTHWDYSTGFRCCADPA